jgi:hypothetical protein
VTAKMAARYPNLLDMIYSPAFYVNLSAGPSISAVAAFWNYVGARYWKQAAYECDVCGEPLKRHGTRHRVCKRCFIRYMQSVRRGEREPVLYTRLYVEVAM